MGLHAKLQVLWVCTQHGEVLFNQHHLRVPWEQRFVLQDSVRLQGQQAVRQGLAHENLCECSQVAFSLRVQLAVDEHFVEGGEEEGRRADLLREVVDDLVLNILRLELVALEKGVLNARILFEHRLLGGVAENS